MDIKTKIFFIGFGLLVLGSVAVSYYKYMVLSDYVIVAEADCDPYTEACFTYVCDPEAGEECTGDPLEDTSYYKIINRNAKNIPLCDSAEEGCEALVCPPDEEDCEIILCDPATAEEGMVCTDPVAYTLEHPIEEREEDIVTEEEDEASGETEDEGNGTDDAGSGATEETASIRDSLVLLEEVSCGKANNFVFGDALKKTPVDKQGNYEAVFSLEKAERIVLANEQGEACAQAISLPQYEGKIYLDAQSTSAAAVFQSPGISTTVPEEAAARLALIVRSASFPALLAYVRDVLPEQDLATLSQQSDFQNLVRQCAGEVLAALR